ncbi:YciI family protein [uncultured Tenacibaculum sp.]|uniref:YciI family protein n=1 Tax=uncultured Tenacibaculum sp. TaxID=174713 RepID=UPI0026201248|nr:YciI family protein [uncultured Tenacibaculum sp.]
MKEFMMIFIGTEYTDLGLSPEEMQNRMGKWFAWSEKMEKQGIVKHGNALTPQIRRIVGKNRTVTDLTSAEVKEIVGGYYIITAKDFDAVQEIAQDFPDYDLGNTVEIREVMVFDQ